MLNYLVLNILLYLQVQIYNQNNLDNTILSAQVSRVSKDLFKQKIQYISW